VYSGRQMALFLGVIWYRNFKQLSVFPCSYAYVLSDVVDFISDHFSVPVSATCLFPSMVCS
jgi:hypothetical protein